MTRFQHHAACVGLTLSLVLPAAALSAQQNEGLDVLFLGNSYIYFNNLPDMVSAMSEALDGGRLRVGAHTHGGYSLQRHLEDGHLPELLSGNPSGDGWEMVVLQEQSALGTALLDRERGRLGAPTAFHTAARRVSEMVRSRGADPVFYMTWAKRGHPDQIDDLSRAYRDIGHELGADVAPAGLAWDRVRRERPHLELFVEDGSHPNATGTYLTACVIYASLTGLSPLGAPATIHGSSWQTTGAGATGSIVELVALDDETAAYLQQVAWDMVSAR